MSRFIEQAIERAGLADVIPARRRGDLAAVRALVERGGAGEAGAIDLLVLGALADLVRRAENGQVVRVHEVHAPSVLWIDEAASELDLLRAVALARITGAVGGAVGVDWGRWGLELAQVALGFGATDLVGPITQKNGRLILEEELTKVKGKGMVARAALKRREIAALVRNAGRECELLDEHGGRVTAGDPPETAQEALHA